MGGYGALLLARHLHAAQLLLISPQISIFEDQVPFDKRFLHYAAKLDPRFDLVRFMGANMCPGVVIYDPNVPEDRIHKVKICEKFPSLRGVAFSFSGHPALSLVSRQKRFGLVLSELKQNQIRPKRLIKLHRSVRRQSLEYRRSLDAYMLKREERRKKRTKSERGPAVRRPPLVP